MSTTGKQLGVVGDSDNGGAKVALDSAKFMSPEALRIAQEGPAAVISHDIRDDARALLNQDSGAHEAGEISQATVDKLATLSGSRITLGSKYALGFNLENFLKFADGGTPEDKLLSLGRIDVTISGPDGQTTTIRMSLDKAVAWQETLAREMKRFNAASVDQKLNRAFVMARADQIGVTSADDKPKMQTTDTAPFEALRTFLPELVLAA